MSIFKRRPLALACFFFFIALLASFYISTAVKIILFSVSLFAAALAFILIFVRKRIRNALIGIALSALFIFLALFSSYRYFDLGYDRLQEYVYTDGRIEATVTGISYRSNFVSYVDIKVSKINGERVATKMKLECEYSFPLEVGDSFLADVRFLALEDDINGYPERMVGIAKGVSLTALSSSVQDIERTASAGFDLMISASKLNTKLGNILTDVIGDESAGLARALLLGDKGALTSAQDRDIRCVGVSHLLALSGMHLTILIGNIGHLLTLVRVPKRVRLPILALLTAAYVVLTGMQLSMVRSAIMLYVAYLAFMLGRERDMLTSLFLSVALICAVSPNALFDIGLQLSFLSMVGIVVFQDTLQAFFDKLFENIRSDIISGALDYFCMSIVITFVAVVSVTPVIWICFGETSLIAALGNLILAPFADLILMLSPFVIIFSKVPLLGSLFGALVGWLSDIMLGVCSLLAKNRGVMLSLRYPFARYIIVYVCVSLFVMLIVEINKKRHFFIPVVSGAAAFLVCFVVYTNIHAGELSVVHITDGNNEGFVAVSEGKALICDVSSGAHSFAQSLVYCPFELAVCDIEVYMLTHYHTRHIATFDEISDEVYIRQLWLPSPESEDDATAQKELRRIAAEKGIEVFVYDASVMNELSFESIEIDIMPRTFIARSNQPIIALSFENGNSRLTYIGSSVHESELYESVLPLAADSDALVFGIHGAKQKSAYSYGALSAELCRAVFADKSVFDLADLGDGDFALSLESADISVGESSTHFIFD